jgi:hypothetical protein
MFKFSMGLFFGNINVLAAFLLLAVMVCLLLEVGGLAWPFFGCTFYMDGDAVILFIMAVNVFCLLLACWDELDLNYKGARPCLYTVFATLSNYLMGCVGIWDERGNFRLEILLLSAQLVWPSLAL